MITNPFTKKAEKVEAPVVIEEVKAKDTDGDDLNDYAEIMTLMVFLLLISSCSVVVSEPVHPRHRNHHGN